MIVFHDKDDRFHDLLVSLARGFDPRIVVPDERCERAFYAIADLMPLSIAQVWRLKHEAGWLLEDLPMYAKGKKP